MLRSVGNGAKDVTLGAASCIPIIGPCVVVPLRCLTSILCFGGKVVFYGVKTVVMIPVKAGSAALSLFQKTPKR